MKRVISFSIYGNDPKYTVGLLRNLELSEKIYPGWIVYIYYNNTVPQDMIDKYKEFSNVELFDMSGYNIPGMFWRFLPNDCERFISRDADSRLSMREKYAVDEWINIGKYLHVMRDHPHHDGAPIMGGLFGIVIEKNYVIEYEVNKWVEGKDRSLFNRWGDVLFLTEVIYEKYKSESNIIEHDSVWSHYPYSKPFPHPMENYNFIGEIFDNDNNRYPQYKEWITRKELR